MRVLVTGGAGFIGGHVVERLLERGDEVHVLDDLSTGFARNVPAGVVLHVGDVSEAADVERAFAACRPEAVSHQAAQLSVARSVADPAYDARVNVLGLVRVLDAAVRHGTGRFVFASSGGVLYGDVSEPADESRPPDPQTPYGITKWAGERYLDFYSRTHGLPTVALRYSNVYGPRQSTAGEAGVVALFSRRMLAGGSVTINGDGRYFRDYVHVDDVARANLLALARPLAETRTAFNVGTAHAIDVNELAARLQRLCTAARVDRGLHDPIPDPQHGPPRAGDLRSNVVSFAKAERELGWTPQVGLDEGLAGTVAWFAEHGE